MDDRQHIKSPEGVAKLMEELWLCHKVGIKSPQNNVFWVDFPQPDERMDEENDDEDQYGAFI